MASTCSAHTEQRSLLLFGTACRIPDILFNALSVMSWHPFILFIEQTIQNSGTPKDSVYDCFVKFGDKPDLRVLAVYVIRV